MNNPQRPILGRLGRLWRIQQVLLLLWLLMLLMTTAMIIVVVVVEGGLGRCSLLLCRTWSGITRLGKVLRHGGESFRRLILIPAPGTVEQSRIVEVFFQIAQGIARMTSLWTDVRDVAKVDAVLLFIAIRRGGWELVGHFPLWFGHAVAAKCLLLGARGLLLGVHLSTCVGRHS